MTISFPAVESAITRGELAGRAGCHLETVRYYEKIGLLPPPARSSNGYRLYRVEDQRRLRFILRGRELGFSIEELRGLLSMVDSESYTCGEIHGLAIDHLDTVKRKIADLKRLQRTLAAITDACGGGAVPECPIIEALWADP